MNLLSVFCVSLSVLVHAGAWLVCQRSPGSGGSAPAGTPLRLDARVIAAIEIPAAAEPVPAAPAVLSPPQAAAEATPTPAAVHSWRPAVEAEAAPAPSEGAARSGPVPAPAVAPPAPSPAPVPTTPPAPAAPVPASAAAASSSPTADTKAANTDAAPPAGPAWRPSGPPPGLRLPASVQNGQAIADLVIDPRDPAFLGRARQLGMAFILFQDGDLGFYLELQGDDLGAAVRRTEVDTSVFSRRARDLAGVRSFDQLRDGLADRYGLDARRCRLAALVPVAVDQAFRQEEAAVLASLHRTPEQVLALCGALTGEAARPLRIDHVLTSDSRWLEVQP